MFVAGRQQEPNLPVLSDCFQVLKRRSVCVIRVCDLCVCVRVRRTFAPSIKRVCVALTASCVLLTKVSLNFTLRDFNVVFQAK